MTIDRMVELLKIERECILRNTHGDCDRRCEVCELVQDDSELHEMYTDVIAMLKAQEPIKRELNTIIRGEYWFNCGACKCPIETTDKYCSNCGRPVKWE